MEPKFNVYSSNILMMREQVCIILNERESEKHAAVASLLELLQNKSITASRIKIDENILEISRLRRPKVFVLDYLLGDYSTGLDVVYEINRISPDKRPAIFFLTDEPSVQVAVEAMQLGVKNYYLLDRKDSIFKLSEEIINTLSVTENHNKNQSAKKISLDSLIFQSKAGINLLNNCKTIIKKEAKSIFILGKPGSGKSTLALALNNHLSPDNTINNIDLKYCDLAPSDITAYPQKYSNAELKSENITYIFNYAEDDNGDIINHFTKYNKKILHGNNRLILCSEDKKTALNWKKNVNTEILEIPELAERKDDIAPLVQHFLNNSEYQLENKIRKNQVEIINTVSKMQWPGNIKELKSVVLDSAIGSSHSPGSIEELIIFNKAKWEEYNSQESYQPPDKLIALRTLEIANFNYRIAAVKLGCSIKSLNELINT